jgi:hypothetical protein
MQIRPYRSSSARNCDDFDDSRGIPSKTKRSIVGSDRSNSQIRGETKAAWNFVHGSSDDAQTMAKLFSSTEAALSSPFTVNSIVAVLSSATVLCTSSNNRFDRDGHILRTLCDEIESICSGDQIVLKPMLMSINQMSSVGLFSHFLAITFQRESSTEARQHSGFCRGPSENLQPGESERGIPRSKRTQDD